MLNKVFKYAESKGHHGGVNYLLGELWRDAPPVLLRGNEAVTRQLLMQTTGERAYTTGVCSFEELASDVSIDTQNEIMDLYEKTIMAGFPSDHYDMMWIRHTDKGGRLELNWHIVNQDLKTGRVLQPYFHKQDKYRLDLAKQIVNDTHNFASPDDPAKQRELTAENNFGSRKEVQERINAAIYAGLENDSINNRDDIILFLNNLNGVEVSRVTSNAITIKITNNDDIKKPIRLKGVVFSEQFGTIEGYLKAKEERAKEYSKLRDERLERNKQMLESANNKIAESRSRLLDAPRPNVRNNKDAESPKQANDNDGVTLENDRIKPFEIRKDGVGSVFEPKCEVEIYAGLEPLDSNLHSSGNVVGDDDWKSFVRVKNETINKLKQSNDEYKNIGNTKVSRNEIINTTAEPEPAYIKLIEQFAEWLNNITQRISSASKHIYKSNERLADASQKLGEAARRREGASREFGKTNDELGASCNRLTQLLDGTDSIGIDLHLTLLSNAKPKTLPTRRTKFKM